MKTPRLKIRLACVALALMVAAVALLRVGSKPAPVAAVTAQPASAKRAVQAPEARHGLAAVQHVLPSVTEPVTDWSAFTPDTIVVAPYEGLALPFHVVRITRENGVTTWVGRNSLRGASLVGIGKRDRWDGVLSLIGGQYDIHIHGQDVLVMEHDAGPIVCNTTAAAKPTSTLKAMVVQNTGKTAEAIAVAGNPGVHTSGTTIYTVEVAFFYVSSVETELTTPSVYDTNGVLHPLVNTVAEVPAYLDSTFRAYVETNNLVLEQSLVGNLRWHFAGMFKAPEYTPRVGGTYPDGRTYYQMGGDLAAMADTTQATGQFVATKTAAVFADQEVLIVGGLRDAGGLADFAGHHAVVHVSGGHIVLAHELGHNFGLYHDRRTDGAADGGSYNYGHIFDYHFSWFGGIDTPPGPINPNTFCDVMGYGSPLPYFSNPNVSLRGNDFASGQITQPDNNLYPLGVEAGQPKAAYAARTLREGAAAMASYRNDPAATFPAIAVQPGAAVLVRPGAKLHLAVVASGTNLTYQWRRNGVAIGGATGASYDVASASDGNAGVYDVVVTNTLGTVISGGTTVAVSNNATSSRLVNISTRSQVGAGDDVQIAGFVISGNSPKTVLVRAGSAVLTGAGLQGVLADPMLELHRLNGGDAVVARNDDWSSDATAADAIRSAANQVGAATWVSGTKDAAVLVTINPGVYTAVVKGKGDSAGMAIVEVYEVGQTSQVVNISTRSHVGVGDDVQIAGFVIAGDQPKTVLVRAGSAVLTAAGLHGVLANPTLELHRINGGDTTVDLNDDWSSDAAKAAAIRSAAVQVGAAAWADGTSDAAILITLNPGLYTAIVRGKNNGTGMAIVEVYDVSQ